ncbi:hypothetical protein POX_a00915 [Penicillium oxalicum]|uniref:hypothetical protein n=1 Tax=Penicillium oxalicum TaxID=69781 RepID=UPI0020B8559A|nr:hypothetical protein POX_a00915 [Penicillium oxalicum]KAI2794320.1 hypothetical protein POX_a00915 [Penicillium oxalicum]
MSTILGGLRLFRLIFLFLLFNTLLFWSLSSVSPFRSLLVSATPCPAFLAFSFIVFFIPPFLLTLLIAYICAGHIHNCAIAILIVEE